MLAEKMIKVYKKDFNILHIMKSGQCFRISQHEKNLYQVIALDHNVMVKQLGDEIIFYCSREEFNNIWFDYFDLSTDYNSIKECLLKLNDSYLTTAIEFGYGIRILRQDLWEVMVSFIISQRNNIPKIRFSIDKLCRGEDHFPSAQEINSMPDSFLSSCGLGYRLKYIKKLAQDVVDKKIELDELKNDTYAEAMKVLLKIYGVGPKVASCIALYGLHHLEAFPIDVWIQRIIRSHPSMDIKSFGQYAGIAQQYMFFYERNRNLS